MRNISEEISEKKTASSFSEAQQGELIRLFEIHTKEMTHVVEVKNHEMAMIVIHKTHETLTDKLPKLTEVIVKNYAHVAKQEINAEVQRQIASVWNRKCLAADIRLGLALLAIASPLPFEKQSPRQSGDHRGLSLRRLWGTT
ncbi:MAG: hypothetical protein ISN28_11320 [Ectothiorhodospiraceae bacterium AqS1]|nr:hypothetical protein [Ectothiorhodospiraceae bacterium AqS1]